MSNDKRYAKDREKAPSGRAMSADKDNQGYGPEAIETLRDVKTLEFTAPPGKIWVCLACGKRARSRLGNDNPRWDESCAVNAVLYDEADLPSCAHQMRLEA
jgi:hypothetical protein